ncbi:hypothetical protein HDU92_008135 [Lobulomyces angularis]|nr:hypothetical protein HDU92_008135 [Lobulomyces angularis]
MITANDYKNLLNPNGNQDNNIEDAQEYDTNELDFKFLNECNDIKKLKSLLHVLQTKEIGFDALETSFKKKIAKLEGWNEERDEKKESFLDLFSFAEEQKKKEKLLIEESKKKKDLKKVEIKTKKKNFSTIAPAINKIKEETPKQKVDEVNEAASSEEGKKMKETKKSKKKKSYREWDLFNVEEEIEKNENIKFEENSGLNFDANPMSIPKLSKEYKVQVELESLSTEEKIKGNDSFRSKDYEDALAHYTRGIEYFPQPTLYSNRAQTHLLLKNYKKCEEDCNVIFSNFNIEEIDKKILLKTYLRRGRSYYCRGEYNKSLEDAKSGQEFNLKHFNGLNADLNQLKIDSEKKIKDLYLNVKTDNYNQHNLKEEDSDPSKLFNLFGKEDETTKKKSKKFLIEEIDEIEDYEEENIFAADSNDHKVEEKNILSQGEKECQNFLNYETNFNNTNASFIEEIVVEVEKKVKTVAAEVFCEVNESGENSESNFAKVIKTIQTAQEKEYPVEVEVNAERKHFSLESKDENFMETTKEAITHDINDIKKNCYDETYLLGAAIDLSSNTLKTDNITESDGSSTFNNNNKIESKIEENLNDKKFTENTNLELNVKPTQQIVNEGIFNDKESIALQSKIVDEINISLFNENTEKNNVVERMTYPVIKNETELIFNILMRFTKIPRIKLHLGFLSKTSQSELNFIVDSILKYYPEETSKLQLFKKLED